MIKEMLGDYVAEQARWRQQKASEYPEDVRNARSGDGLWDLALYIRGLPENEQRLVAIEREHDDAGTGTFQPGEVTARLISRFRFNIPNETFDGLLIRIPDALAEDKAQWVHELLDPIPDEFGDDMDKVIERLRRTKLDGAGQQHEAGREFGVAWAKEEADAADLDGLANIRDENWVSWQMPDDLVEFLEAREAGKEFGYRFGSGSGQIHIETREPFIEGLIEGALSVWSAVKDKL